MEDRVRRVGLLASVVVTLVAAYGLLVVGPVGTRGGPARAQAAEQQLDTRQGLYPRVIRLEHSGAANGRIVASVSASSTGGVTDIARIYESTDAGVSFHQIGEVHDPQADGGRGSCCGSLFELPQQLGAQPAGTLLFGTTVGLKNSAPGRRPAIRVWRSADGGHTWTYLSSCAAADETTPTDQGMWEPEFSVDSRGYLDCYFSDETQAGFSQVLAAVTSTDGGVTWGSRRNVVATASGDRPGMANVRRLPGGSYFMSYELCGQRADACRVYYRTSADGWNWGDPANPGTVAATPDGRYLYRTPTIAWTPGGGPRGRILLIGGLVKNAQGQIMPASGSTIFVNTENGFGHWFEVPAPVTVGFSASPDQQELVCNNYSPSLLPSADGASVLELATKRRADGSCGAFFASGPTTGTGTAGGVASGTTYRLRNVQSGVCLDVAKGSTASGANVQQWTCNGLAPQDWKLTGKGSGYFTLTAKVSGLCLDVSGGSTAPGANVQQWTCNGTGAQLWRVVNVGRSYYTLTAKVSGLCLDVSGGSTAPGANVQQWTCNQLAPQIWRLEVR
jgi:Ricin-type beta-trefoil lectin domain-like